MGANNTSCPVYMTTLGYQEGTYSDLALAPILQCEYAVHCMSVLSTVGVGTAGGFLCARLSIAPLSAELSPKERS